ncbi:MAG TPA: pyridoxal-phosphate dependent enzyme, partial [Geminicoccaceae bacterium]|nr:pyridoxal-phosphate dependent enzyme [Geminicoccaceae bacterium]
MKRVTLRDIYEAREAIRGVACRTLLVPAPRLSAPGREIFLKLETTQPVGAFKIRGAANALARLGAEARRRGVVCASTGNHGRAVAFAARRLGVPACVCMSRLV